MANESQEDLARYYQGLANQAADQAKTLAGAEAAGLAERKRIADQIASLNRQRQTAITQADRDRIDNSIRVQTNNLQKTDSGITQLQQQRNAALGQVTANEDLAKKAVGGSPAAQNIPGPDVVPAPPAAAPSTIPVTPAAAPAAAPPPPPPAPPPQAAAAPPPFGSTQADGNAGESAALRLPQPSAPQDFVTDRDGNLLPSDSSAAADRRAEIAAEENRARWDNSEPQPDFTFDRDGNPVYAGSAAYDERRLEEAEEAQAIRWSNSEPQPDFTFDRDGNPVYAGTPEYTERQNELTDEANAIRWSNSEPQPDFVYDRSGNPVYSGSPEYDERVAEIAEEEQAVRWSNSEPQPDFLYDRDGNPVYAGTPEYTERQNELTDEQNAVRWANAEPQPDFVIDPVTGEQVPSDSDRAAEIRAEEAANAPAPEPVPPNVSVIQDENGTWGVWNDDEGRFIVEGLSQQEAQLQADEIAAGFGVQARPFPPGALVTEPAPVPSGEWTAVLNDGSGPGDVGTWYIVNENGEIYQSGIVDGNEARIIAENLSLGSAEALPQGTPGGTGLTPEEQAAKEQAAAKAAAINQATRQSLYKQAGSSDWRVRLQLAPTSNYLYNASPAGILAPLAATNGVVFPYTPQINTSYQAKYADYDLVHSNFRGVFYQNSRVDDINMRAIFTAQDTREADYLLAVIHFFRSVTKMFYGAKDQYRGTPPPLVYLSGFGMDQFYGHPCLVKTFVYNLPDNVDYIRATNVNNYGTDLLSRRTASKGAAIPGGGATVNRIANAGLDKFFPSKKPAPDPVVGSVNNTQLANYVPTKMEIDITLIPVQTRSQVSKQFSMDGFANGNLLRGGFW
jgi:hypothetical protein